MVIHQANLGLAAARNNGISIAKGKYIMPLDCDDKINGDFLLKAINILENDSRIDIVYGDHQFFGEQMHYMWNSKFDIVKILNGNYVCATALYRKSLWDALGGYDSAMPFMGCEDWEFWVAGFFKGANFFYLNELCFFYRALTASMSHNTSNEQLQANQEYILKKHAVDIFNYLQSFYAFHKQ